MISREWSSYLIKATFAEREGAQWPSLATETIAKHASSALPEFEARITRLPTPIVSETASVLDVYQAKFEGKTIRAYPPFLIDANEETKGAFASSWIPEGNRQIERYTAVSSTATLGVTATQAIGTNSFYCEALRIDVEEGADYYKFIHLLIENICQHTHQWWLRGRAHPFRGMGRLRVELNSDFSLREILRYKGAGTLGSTWQGIGETQQLLGFERPLNNSLWLRCCHDAEYGMRGDSGILSFHDAISYYMSGDDVLCIMSLSIAVEILGNKRRILKGKEPTGFAKLLKTSDLIDSKNKTAIDRLFRDRGHVAHGRQPHYAAGKNSQAIEEYIEAVQLLVSRYLGSVEPGEWPIASQLAIDRKSTGKPQ